MTAWPSPVPHDANARWVHRRSATSAVLVPHVSFGALWFVVTR